MRLTLIVLAAFLSMSRVNQTTAQNANDYVVQSNKSADASGVFLK
jgi:hypothetical protein